MNDSDLWTNRNSLFHYQIENLFKLEIGDELRSKLVQAFSIMSSFRGKTPQKRRNAKVEETLDESKFDMSDMSFDETIKNLSFKAAPFKTPLGRGRMNRATGHTARRRQSRHHRQSVLVEEDETEKEEDSFFTPVSTTGTSKARKILGANESQISLEKADIKHRWTNKVSHLDLHGFD